MAQKQMLNLEFSWGRWNGEDVQAMLEPIQILATRLSTRFVHCSGLELTMNFSGLEQLLQADDEPYVSVRPKV